MNTIVEHINSAGHTFMEFALPMLIQSSVLIVILLLLDLLLRKKVKAVFRYWIWMLVLLKLILPTSLSSPFSLGYLFGEKLTYQDLAQTSLTLEPAVPAPAEISSDVGSIYIQPNPYIPPAEPVVSVTEPVIAETVGPPPVPATPLSWQGVVFLVWLAVVIAMGLLLLQRALFVRGLVAQAKKAGHLMNDALSYCCASMGIKAKVGLKISVNATTPSVCGLIRPVILVPWKLTSTLGASRLRTILMHELAHIRRGDLWVNLIQTALQIIYFYNPLLWLANLVIRRIREQAVDEAVLVAMGEKAQKYPQTLVDVAKMAFKRPALGLRLIGVVESRSALAGRIKHILGRPMPKTAKLGIIGLLAVVIAGVVLLPMARAREAAFAGQGGPLNIRLAGVRPDGSDVIYDGNGNKIAENTFANIANEWGEGQQYRTFIFELPKTEEPILFSPFLKIKPTGAKRGFGTGQHPLLYDSADKLIYSMGVSFPRTYKKVFERQVEKVDLTLPYYYGRRGTADFVFTGPFTAGKTIKADGGADCELTPKEDLLNFGNHPAAYFRISSETRFDGDSVLIYDTSGRRYLLQIAGGGSGRGGTHYNYRAEGLTLNSIAYVTVGEKPYEAVFKNLVVSYPDRPVPERLEFLDEMCERLDLTGFSGDLLNNYTFKNPADAIKVIDIVRGHWYVMKVFRAIRYGESGIELSNLDSQAQQKVRSAAARWAKAGHPKVREMGIRLGLVGGWPEFMDMALDWLEQDVVVYDMGLRTYRGLEKEAKEQVAGEVESYPIALNSEQAERFKKLILRMDSPRLGMRLFRIFWRADEDLIYQICWDLVQDDRPWIWWPAMYSLSNRCTGKLRPFENLPEKIQKRLILVHEAGGSSRLFHVSSSGKDYETVAKEAYAMLPGMFTARLARMDSSICHNVHQVMAKHLDREIAAKAMTDFLREISTESNQRLWAGDSYYFGTCCSTAYYIARHINSLYDANIDNLGKYEARENSEAIPRHISQLKQLIAKTLQWNDGRNGAGNESGIAAEVGMADKVEEHLVSLDHFVGRYALAGHPDTAFFEITKEGDVFIFRDLGGPKFEMDIVLRGLEGREFEMEKGRDNLKFGEKRRDRFCVRYNAAEGRYILDGLGMRGRVQDGFSHPLTDLVKISAEKPGDKIEVPVVSLDHFVGRYALAGHPDTAAFEITKRGDAFIFRDLGGPKFEMELVLKGLAGRSFEMEKGRDNLKFGGSRRDRFCVRYNAAEDRYILDRLGMRGEVQDGVSFPLTDLVKVPAEKPENIFAATLPNGVTVELMGICELPDQGKQWWAADGSLLEDVFWEGSTANRESSVDARQVVFRIRSNQNEPAPTVNLRPKRSLQPPGSWSGAFFVRKDNQTLEDFRGCSFSLHDDQKIIDISADIGYGPWKTLTKLAMNSEISLPKPVFTDIGYITWNEPTEEGGKTTVSATLFDGLKVWRIVAVDKQGDIHTSSTALGHGFDGHQIVKSTFSLPLSRIDKFRFQTRPFGEIIFKNVSLEPNFKTNVQVEVEVSEPVFVEETVTAKVRPYVRPGIESNVSPKLVMLLDAINSCAAETDLNIDSVSITAKNISMKGDTSGRANSRKFLDVIKDNGLSVLSMRLNAADNRDKFSVIVEPKQDWQQWWRQRKTDVQFGAEETVSPKLIMLLVAIKSVATEMDLNIESISISAKSMSIGGDTSRRTDTLKFLDAIKENGLEVSQLNLDARNNRDRFRIAVEPKESWRQWWQQYKTDIKAEVTAEEEVASKLSQLERILAKPPIVAYDVKLNFADPTARDGSFHSEQSVAFSLSFHNIEIGPAEKFTLGHLLIGQTTWPIHLEENGIAIHEGVSGQKIKSLKWPSGEPRFDKVIKIPVKYGNREYSCPVRVDLDRYNKDAPTGAYWFCAYLSGRLPWGAGGRGFEIVNLDQQMEFRLIGDGTDPRDAVLGIDINGDGKIDSAKEGGEQFDLYEPFVIGSKVYQLAEVDPYLPRVVFHEVDAIMLPHPLAKADVPVEVEGTGEENQVIWGKPSQGVQVGVIVEKEKWRIGGDVPRLNVEVRVSDPKKFRESGLAEKAMTHDWSAFAVEVDGKRYKQNVFTTVEPVPLLSPFKIVLSLDDEWQGGLYGQEWLSPGRHKIRVLFVGLGMRLPSEPVEIEILPEDKKIEPWPYPWGEAVRGVQISAHPAQPSWPVGSEPVIRICLRNQGKEKWSIHERPSSFAIEVDGKRYENNFIFHVWRRPFEPGDVYQFDLNLSKSKSFHDGLRKGNVWPPVGKSPPLLPGKHTVRVLFTELRIEPEPASHLVEFEIVPATSDVRVEAEKPVVGEWKDVGNPIPADFNDTIALTEQITLGSIGQDVEEKTFITFIWDREKDRNRQYRFVLINKKGTVFEPDSHLILDENGRLKEKFTFDEPYVSWRLKEFKFQNRPLLHAVNRTISSKLQKDTSTAFEGKTISPSKLAPPGRYAIELDGVDDYLLIPDSPTLRLRPPFTVEMWIKPRSPEQKPDRMQQWGVIAQGGYVGTGRAKPRGFGIELTCFEKEPETFNISYTEANDEGLFGQDYGRYPFDEWMHISHVFEGENYKPSHGHPLVIGRFLIPFPEPFMGQIGEVRIWNGARKREEIRRYKNRALTGKEPGLAACWTFEQAEGQFAYDISGNNNHARLGRAVEADGADPKWVDLEAAPHQPGRIADVPVEVEGTAKDEIGRLSEVEKRRNIPERRKGRVEFLGLDLTDAPHTTKSADLPDLFEERPPGSKSYEIASGVTVMYGGFDGTVYYIPEKEVFYIQQDKLGSSTLTYYGPFDGDPKQVLDRGIDVPIKPEKAEASSGESVPASNEDGPRITFESLVCDLGRIPQYTKHVCEFKYTNTGNEVLKITRVAAACACTSPQQTRECAPGESGMLKVTYQPGASEGKVKKHVYVYSNDKVNPRVQLTIKAEIVIKVKHEPKRLNLVLDKENAGCPAITLTSLDDQPFSITGFKSTGDSITADFDSSLERTSFVIRPKVDMEKLKKGMRGQITIDLDHPECKKITVLFETLTKFKTEPRVVYVREAEPQKPVTKKVRILSNYNEDFEIESTSSRNRNIKVLTQEKIRDGYQLELQITPPEQESKRRVFTDVFTVELKGDQKLQITCFGIYAKKPAETAGESAPKSDVHLEVAKSGGDSVYGSGDIIVVSEGKSKVYGSIQEAIDAAPAGSIVRIGPGVYKERLEIDTPLTLEGAGWDQTTIVTENNTADAFEEAISTFRKRILEAKSEEHAKKLSAELQAQFEAEMKENMAAQTHIVSDTGNVVIRNLKLTSPGRSIEGRALSVPIIKFSNAGALVTGCAVVGTPGDGIHVVEGSDVQIRDSLVAGVWSTGIAVASGRGDIAKASIINCDVRNCHHRGITIGPGCDSTVVRGCRISGSSWHGIRYDDASPTIVGNLIFANVRCGIYASGRTAADVRQNLFYGNEMTGISCWFKNQDTIEENTFVGNKRSGLEVLGASKPIVRKNIFYANPTAVFCGDIGDDSASAASDGTVNLEENLFWGFEYKVAWRHAGDTIDEFVTDEVELDEKTRNAVFDPEFKDITAEDFSLNLDSSARRSGIGAAVLIDSESPWPLQDEEIAVIPEDKTEDTSWMGQISSTGKITRPVVVPVANKGGKKLQESIKDKPRKQEGSDHPGRISGVVVNSDTGDPIVGAYVGVGDFGDSGGSNYSRHRSEGFHDKTKTDAEGRFELGGLVFTDKHRYLKYHPLVVTHPDFVRHDEKIELLSSGPVPDITVKLRPAAKIEVTVVDADGNPLPGQWLLRLEALNGRRFIPPGSDPHLSSFASNIWAHWPDLRTQMGISNGFTFTALDTGEYSIEALKFQLVDKPSPGNIWKPTITYHGSIPNVRVKAGQAKQVNLEPQDYPTRLTITHPEYPDKLMDKLERSSRMPLMCLVSRSPGALLWDDGKIHHLEDQRLGRIDQKRFFRGFFIQGKPLTINNLPPDSYSLFAMAVYGEVAGYLIGARADLEKGDKITVDIPWRQPTGPSMFGPNRSFDYPVNIEARQYSLSELCGIITDITQSNPRIIADTSIENEKLSFGKSDMSVWDVLEKLYLDNGWRVDEGQDKTLIIKPASQTDVQSNSRQDGSNSLLIVNAVDNKAALTSGATVELLGLTYIPVAEDLWWRTDGSPLPKAPFDDVSFTPSVDPNWQQFAYYTVAIQIKGKLPREIGLLKWNFTDAVYGGSTSAYADEKRVYYDNIHSGAVKFPKAVKRTKLRLGIVSGDWQTLVKGSHYGVYREGEDSIIVRTPERAGGPLGVHPGEKGLHIGVTYNVTDRDFRVVAVDKDGKVHLSSRGGSGGTDNLRRTTASFPELTHDRLQEFRFQVRPYEWVEFKDVSLRPSEKAFALAGQRRIAKQKKLEKWLGQGKERRIREQILILRESRLDHINEPCVEQTEVISAMRELVRISEPAVQGLTTELRQAEHWLEKSLIAFVLRAIGNKQAVSALVDTLGRSNYRGEYGIYVKDDELAEFMLDHQHREPDESDRKVHSIIIACPVIEVTKALEKITQHSEGPDHFSLEAAEVTKGRWQKWWDRNKTDVPIEESLGEARVVHFPAEQSLGKLCVQRETISAPVHWWWGLHSQWQYLRNQWQYLAEARGDVTIPAGKRLGLIVGRDGLKTLAHLAKLRPDDLYMLKIKCGKNAVDKPGNDFVPHLARLTGLKELILEYPGITNEGLRPIRGLSSLERLSLISGQLDDTGMAHISELESLKGLRFYGRNVTNTGLSHLSKLTSLEELFPSGIIDDEGLVHLTKLPALRYLLLTTNFFTENGLAHLKGIPSLRKLKLGGIEFSSEGIAHISRIPGLEELSINNTVLSDEDIVPLKSMNSLKRLSLSPAVQQMARDFTDEALFHLSRIKSLESLVLGYGKFTDKGLEYLAEMDNLKRLDIPNNSGFTDAGLSHLAKMPLLEELKLRANQFTDVGMSYIAKLTNLKRLDLWGHRANITNKSLAQLADIRKLSYLVITGHFNDEGLAHVGNLNKLSYLDISGDFTDEGLHRLEGLNLLKQLKIRSENKLSPQALQDLRSKLPNLLVLS